MPGTELPLPLLKGGAGACAAPGALHGNPLLRLHRLLPVLLEERRAVLLLRQRGCAQGPVGDAFQDPAAAAAAASTQRGVV